MLPNSAGSRLIESMFRQLDSALSRRHLVAWGVSLSLHALFLIWLAHRPDPVFIAPSYVVRGEGGHSVEPLYFPRQRDSAAMAVASELSPRQHITLERHSKLRASKSRPPVAKALPAGTIASTRTSDALRAGSPYGSLSEGALIGFEVRPALFASGTDPIISSGDLPGGAEGNVVVEITIDEQGNVVRTIVLQSLAAQVDTKVVAALESWHFHPATRDGVPIASKQDVYYHFPIHR
jgi:TonB family protein